MPFKSGWGGPRGTRLTPERVAYLERVHAAIELRKRGKSFQDIAAICGWKNRNGAYLAISRYVQNSIREASDDLVELELARLDALLDAVWDNCMGGDPKSIAAALKIMERRAKLLGLDKPVSQKIEVSRTDAAPTPPVDLGDYSAKLLATLHMAGAIDLPLAPEHRYLGQGGLILDSEAEDLGTQALDALIAKEAS